jgi:hypothetical protein
LAATAVTGSWPPTLDGTSGRVNGRSHKDGEFVITIDR